MKKINFFLAIFYLIFLFITFSKPSIAKGLQTNGIEQTPKQMFYTGNVVRILKQGEKTIAGIKNPFQILQIRILDGTDKGKLITIDYGGIVSLTPQQEVKVGDTVILQNTQNAPNGKNGYMIYDKYRLTNIIYIAIVFFLLVILIAGWKGLGSLFGLSVSLAVILLYMIPQILSGSNPLQTSIIASLVILLITTYLAHGVSKQTTVALFSTFVSLMITVFLSSFFVRVTELSGMTSENSTLLFGPTSHINLQGLLLAGIIIGTLGALNDITTTQSATIFELAQHEEKASFQKLFVKGFYIGREHIVSMINTLVLAYAGSALALLLFFVLNPQKIPYWVIINNEDLSDEIIRTLAGSMGLILVVPIVTFFAAFVFDKKVQQFFRNLI